MNVAFDKWIPVVNVNSEYELISLYEVMTQGDKFRDLSVLPHERVSLMRLFLCVAYAAMDGPKDYDEWERVPENLAFASSEYLENWKESFELFHPEKPWLQIATLSKHIDSNEKKDWTPVSKLFLYLANGNNSTLFDHDGMNNYEREISLEKVLLSMISFQNFSVGGRIPTVFWCGQKTTESAKDAPCVPDSMMHGSLRGKNLTETIHLNLVHFEDIQRTNKGQEIGRPIWECFPQSLTDEENIYNATRTYVGRLVPLSRAILLSNDYKKMLLGECECLIYPKFDDGFFSEPTCSIIIKEKNKKEEYSILSYRSGKNIWRELNSIILKRTSDNIGGPLFLVNLNENIDCDLVVDVVVRSKSSIVNTIESVFHISSNLVLDNGPKLYDEEVKFAEKHCILLGRAIETYRQTIDNGWKSRLDLSGPKKGLLKSKLELAANIIFWTTIEKNIGLLMSYIDAIETEQAILLRDMWREIIIKTTKDIYYIVCGQETPRGKKAFALGYEKLFYIPKEKTNINLEEQNEESEEEQNDEEQSEE